MIARSREGVALRSRSLPSGHGTPNVLHPLMRSLALALASGLCCFLPCLFAPIGGNVPERGGDGRSGERVCGGGRGSARHGEAMRCCGRGGGTCGESAARCGSRTGKYREGLLRVEKPLPGRGDRLAGAVRSVSRGRGRRLERGGRRPGVRRGPAERAGSLAMRKRRPASRAADSRIGGEVERVIGR